MGGRAGPSAASHPQAHPLSTGRSWDPNSAVLRDAQVLAAECAAKAADTSGANWQK